MAVRKRILHDDATRQKIQTSQLINRLQASALGEIDLTATQLKSIEILLRKTLPDLSAVDHTSQGESITGVRWLTEAEWLALSITQESNSEPTTNEHSDMQLLSGIDGPAKH